MAPPVWIALLIFRYGVDVPYLDDWHAMVPLFQKSHAGSLTLSDFFAQHNEHRVFFPRLILFGLAKLTHWNCRTELWTVWLAAWVWLLALVGLARTTGCFSFGRGWQIVAASALVFTPLAHENWLFGFMFSLLMPVGLVAISIWLACATPFPLNFISSMAVCGVCTFSIANGFTSWLLIMPILLFRQGRLEWRGRAGWWLAWLVCFLASTALYFHGYQKPAHHPSILAGAQHPVDALLFFLAYLGNPFTGGTIASPFVVAECAGAGLLLLLGLAVGYTWAWRRDATFISQALPWLTLAFGSLVNGAFTTVGRFGFGLYQALPSRYLPFCVSLPIGLVFLGPLIFDHWRARKPDPDRVLRAAVGLGACTAVFVLLHVLALSLGTAAWKARHHALLTCKAVIELIHVIDPSQSIANFVLPEGNNLPELAGALDDIGYLRPKSLRSRDMTEISSSAPGTLTGFGEMQPPVNSAEGRPSVFGWAILPNKQRVADAVVLSYDDQYGKPMMFALAMVGSSKPEVSSALNDPDLERCGWGETLVPTQIPPEARILRAWAFDAEACHAYPLKGVVTIQQ